jgi:hypothetical protein
MLKGQREDQAWKLEVQKQSKKQFTFVNLPDSSNLNG